MFLKHAGYTLDIRVISIKSNDHNVSNWHFLMQIYTHFIRRFKINPFFMNDLVLGVNFGVILLSGISFIIE